MSNKREYAIGEEVIIEGLTYVCVEGSDEPCVQAGCDLQMWQCEQLDCVADYRTDNKDVIFKLKEE